MGAFDDLSEEDKAEISRQNAILNRLVGQVFGAYMPNVRQIQGLVDGDGKPVQWTDLAKGKYLYRHWISRKTGRHYCYTPWKDTNGWYWAFNYTDKGPVTDAVRFRKRKAAKQRAADRYADDAGMKRWKVGST